MPHNKSALREGVPSPVGWNKSHRRMGIMARRKKAAPETVAAKSSTATEAEKVAQEAARDLLAEFEAVEAIGEDGNTMKEFRRNVSDNSAVKLTALTDVDANGRRIATLKVLFMDDGFKRPPSNDNPEVIEKWLAKKSDTYQCAEASFRDSGSGLDFSLGVSRNIPRVTGMLDEDQIAYNKQIEEAKKARRAQIEEELRQKAEAADAMK